MKQVSVNLKDWSVFDDAQEAAIRDVVKQSCEDSVRFCVQELFEGAEASIALEGDEFFLSFTDAEVENYLGRVAFSDVFASYTDADKLGTKEAKLQAINMRDALGQVISQMDIAIKKA